MSKFELERKSLDYSYFPQYPITRQLSIQDVIIEKFLNDNVEPVMTPRKKLSHPWLIYTCGAYGSGKSHSLKHYGFFPNTNFVLIDPDRIKTEILRLSLSNSDEEKTNTINQNELHLESTFIASILEFIMIKHKRNVFIDGSLHDHEWYRAYFKDVKTKHPHYQLGIIRVNCSLKVALERCLKRGLDTKRTIPVNVIQSIHEKSAASFQILQNDVDVVIEMDNELAPKIKSVKFNYRPMEFTPRIPPFLCLF